MRRGRTGSKAPTFTTNCKDSPKLIPLLEEGEGSTLGPEEQDGLEMVALHIEKLHAAKELLLGEVVGNVGQVHSSLAMVALVQVVFVLEDFLQGEGQGNLSSPARRAWLRPRHHTHSSPHLRHTATA